MYDLKFCKFCGEKIAMDAVICPKCGRQVEQLQTSKNFLPIIINNNNNNNNNNNASSTATGAPSFSSIHLTQSGKRCYKWISLLLCIWLGFIGGHKFYVGKIGTGILYACTCGLFCLGWFFDFFNILGKTHVYYVQ